jgi:hypothetical protein
MKIPTVIKIRVKSSDIYLDVKQSEFCGKTSIPHNKFNEQMISKGMIKKKFKDATYWIMMKKKFVSQIFEEHDDEL